MGKGLPDKNHADWWATLVHESAHTVTALHFGFLWAGTQIGTGAEAFGGTSLRDPNRTSDAPTREGAIVAAAGGLAEDWVAVGSRDDAERKSDRCKVRKYAESIGRDVEVTADEIDSAAKSLVLAHRPAIEQLAAILDARDGRISSFEVAAVQRTLALSCPRCDSGL